ncbi:relaxase/mobilization nuclease RlxS [Allosphingosinicella vermicomposti]|uniref:relaxase/mobilization nuclease RlxS n=1 Tax=Allosphingosinicella vermicomposti TaxID=614671 RepID=UPI000D110DF7|nr:relaxase/mobilization nuclease RlxS [Allosphingosinicella vermicomposti]
MAGEETFEPRLGKIRSMGSKRGRKYLHQVLRAANLAGVGAARNSGFHGNRIGRGAGVGRVLAARNRMAAFRQRRVVIKSRIVKLAGKALAGAHAHLRYIQRDGVTRDGEPGALYNAASDRADGKDFMERAAGDRHQFRFIVSAEDGSSYDDLKPLTRRLMTQMEEDLGTKLDWVAVDHFNTGHPHTHIMLRGRDERGKDLIVARDYMASGMRERAAEIVQLDLGPRTDRDIETRLEREVEQERLTSLDRRLLRAKGVEGLVSPQADGPFRQAMLTRRLVKLTRLGLADETAPGRWHLAEDLETTLRRMGERGDIIKTMHRQLGAKGAERALCDYAVFDPTVEGQREVVGRVLARGLSDELSGRYYLLVDGLDGRIHYADVGSGDVADLAPDNAIVCVSGRKTGVRPVDRMIANIAAENDGRYSVDLHLRHDPQATEAFASTHVRRLEAVRRSGATLDRQPDGSWNLGDGYLAAAASYEERQARARPVAVELLSREPLERQLGADAPTWLDRELTAATPLPLRDAGFGRAVREAQAIRRQWLLDQGLAEERSGGTVYRAGMLATLQRRELLRAGAQLMDELGLRFTEAKAGERIEGKLARQIDLVGGRYALVEKSKEFTLVPWRRVLEERIGKQVTGIVRPNGSDVNWTFGRSRGQGVS